MLAVAVTALPACLYCSSVLPAGYEKMPDYEAYMVQFLRSICFRGQEPQQQAAQQAQQAAQQQEAQQHAQQHAQQQ